MYFCGEEVSNSDDVDIVTKIRIYTLAGDYDEQLKGIRRCVRAVALLSNKQLLTPEQVKEYSDVLDKYEVLDNEIEGLVREGKAFKSIKGLV